MEGKDIEKNYIVKALTFNSRWNSVAEAIEFMTGASAIKRLFEISASSQPRVRNGCSPKHCSPDVRVSLCTSSSSSSSSLSLSELS